jgi:hypothetical protein
MEHEGSNSAPCGFPPINVGVERLGVLDNQVAAGQRHLVMAGEQSLLASGSGSGMEGVQVSPAALLGKRHDCTCRLSGEPESIFKVYPAHSDSLVHRTLFDLM